MSCVRSPSATAPAMRTALSSGRTMLLISMAPTKPARIRPRTMPDRQTKRTIPYIVCARWFAAAASSSWILISASIDAFTGRNSSTIGPCTSAVPRAVSPARTAATIGRRASSRNFVLSCMKRWASCCSWPDIAVAMYAFHCVSMTASLRAMSSTRPATLPGSAVRARDRLTWFSSMARTILSSSPTQTSPSEYMDCIWPLAWPRLTRPTVAPTISSRPRSAITKMRRALMVIFFSMMGGTLVDAINYRNH